MAFNLLEISTQNGRPVSLYEFLWGATAWRYTDADRAIEYPAGSEKVYLPVAIKDEGVQQGGSASDFEVSIPATLPLVDLFRTTPPAASIWLTVFRHHYGDDGAAVEWIGTIGNVKRVGRAEAKVFGLPISGTMRRTGLRLCWEIDCPHMLYDSECKANKALFKHDTTITALTPTTMTILGLGLWPGARYAGGFFEWEATAEGTLDRRGIESWIAGTSFTIFGTTDRLAVGQEVSLYLGCDLTAETCQNIFNNLPNHGGFRFMPKKSPFDGSPVF